MIFLIFVVFEFISLAIISTDSPISSIFRMSTTEFDNLLSSRLIKNDNLDIVAFGIYVFWYIPAIRFCDSRDMSGPCFFEDCRRSMVSYYNDCGIRNVIQIPFQLLYSHSKSPPYFISIFVLLLLCFRKRS